MMVEQTKEQKNNATSQSSFSNNLQNIALQSKNSQQNTHGLPPMQPIASKNKTSFTNSDFDSDKQTFDVRHKNNSRVSSTINKFFGQGAVPIEGDPLSDEDGNLYDEHTQNTIVNPGLMVE